MKRLRFGFVLSTGFILIGLFTILTADAQNFRTRDECIKALTPRCMNLMEPTAKRSCFKGNQVYCQKFPAVILTPEQKGEDMSQEGMTRVIDLNDKGRMLKQK